MHFVENLGTIIDRNSCSLNFQLVCGQDFEIYFTHVCMSEMTMKINVANLFRESDWCSIKRKNSILLQCLSVSAMDTSRNRTWPRRMAGLLWVVFLFVGVSAGTLEKLHEGESSSRLRSLSNSVYFKRIVSLRNSSIFQKEPIFSRLIIVSHNERNCHYSQPRLRK